MTTLALDLGQTIGWVRGPIVGPMTFGSFQMPKTTHLGRWLRGIDDLARQIFPGVAALVIEQPFLGQDYWPARKLISSLGHVHYFASFYDIPVVNEIPVATGKLNLSGHGNADAPMMIAAALERYGLEMNEHEAHALGIWDVHQFGRRERITKARSRSSKGVVVKP